MKPKLNLSRFKSFHSSGLDPYQRDIDLTKKIYYHAKSLKILLQHGEHKDKKLAFQLKELSEKYEAKLIAMGESCHIEYSATENFGETVNSLNTNVELLDNQCTCKMCGQLSKESIYEEVCESCAASLT